MICETFAWHDILHKMEMNWNHKMWTIYLNNLSFDMIDKLTYKTSPCHGLINYIILKYIDFIKCEIQLLCFSMELYLVKSIENIDF